MSDRRSNAKKISREKSIPGNKKIITKTTQNQLKKKILVLLGSFFFKTYR